VKRTRPTSEDRPLLRLLTEFDDGNRGVGVSLAVEGDDEAALDSEECCEETGGLAGLTGFTRFRGELYRLLSQLDRADLAWPSSRDIEAAITAGLSPEEFAAKVLRD